MGEETRDLNRLNEFQCRRCNACCRQPGFVYLSEQEAGEAARFLNMDAFDFVNRFCEVQDRKRLVLKKHADEACVFLTDSGCSIHPAKPGQCRDFPVKWRTPASFEYCNALQTIYNSK